MARISVRALHHYDQIGLVRPSARSPAGYRLYQAADLARLERVMWFKVLGFALEEIRRLVDRPRGEVREALVRRRRLLREEAAEIEGRVAAVDAALAALEKGNRDMSDSDRFEAFEGFDPALYEDEARERWGDTEAYREAARRTAGYGPAEWQELKDESEDIFRALAEALAAGAAPGDPRVQALAERHRLHIERWFYPCSRAMHRGLSELYVNDPRFTRTIDRHGAGLAGFLRDAIAVAAGADADA